MNAIETPSSLLRERAAQTTFMKFGTQIPMCAGCLAVRVDEKGERCLPCVRVLVNQQKAQADRDQAVRQLKLICFGIIAFLACAAASWVWLAN